MDLEPLPAPATSTGPDIIRAFVKQLPSKPGVYRMFDHNGDVIYVGKARNLRNRVANYTRAQGHTNRIATMIAATRSMEFVTTDTEAQALLLEANLIKRLKPRFNVLLRDDKSFPYILIAREHPFAQLTKHRGARTRKGDYFGPFASAGAVNRSINTLQKAFLLRTCTDSFFENRTRPCLLYQIKRCSAPCTSEITNAAYGALVADAEEFLSGKSRLVKADLARQMEASAEALDFEQAARIRDRIQAMSFVTAEQSINPETVVQADVFGLAQEGGFTCIQVFFIRAGQNWGNRPYYPRADKSVSAEEILSAFLAQFYEDKPVPPLVLLSHEIEEPAVMEEALATLAGRRVEIAVPQRGEKRTLVDHAVTNAREAMGRRLAETGSQAKLLAGVAAAFGLARTPRRIEIYDNSHVSGAHAVGAMVVSGPEGFMKSHYRKFNIKTPDSGNDDFAMMREVFQRRFSRLLAEEPVRHDKEADDVTRAEDDDSGAALPDTTWPDLVLVDGGEGQLSVAHDVLQELGVTSVALVGVSKGPDRDAGREHFHRRNQRSFMLDARDPVLFYLQRLRDEAHRFAIGAHRQKRARALSANPLDDIAGIGPKRKKALLQAFGSAKAVARASIADLAAVEGVNMALAEAIYGHFQNGPR